MISVANKKRDEDLSTLRSLNLNFLKSLVNVEFRLVFMTRAVVQEMLISTGSTPIQKLIKLANSDDLRTDDIMEHGTIDSVFSWIGWRINYNNNALSGPSQNPCDPTITHRSLCLWDVREAQR